MAPFKVWGQFSQSLHLDYCFYIDQAQFLTSLNYLGSTFASLMASAWLTLSHNWFDVSVCYMGQAHWIEFRCDVLLHVRNMALTFRVVSLVSENWNLPQHFCDPFQFSAWWFLDPLLPSQHFLSRVHGEFQSLFFFIFVCLLVLGLGIFLHFFGDYFAYKSSQRGLMQGNLKSILIWICQQINWELINQLNYNLCQSCSARVERVRWFRSDEFE